MKPRTERLSDVGGAPLGPSVDADTAAQRLAPLGGAPALAELLARKNGFYAFESALHVFSIDELVEWNRAWQAAYGALGAGLLLFAEDVFGGPFAVSGADWVSVDPETGQRERLGGSLEELCAALLADYEVLTGYPLSHEWQVRHGALQPGLRLGPLRPFVLGGAFSIDNLKACAALDLMRERSRLAHAIAGLPDGARLRWPLPD